MSIKVLIVDDSAFMRKIISDQINKMDGIQVCGIARNGMDVLKSIEKFNPDLITLDIEMPGMNGFEVLKCIKKECDIPVIMLSSHSGEDITISCLELGAMDFIEKPQNLKNISEEFYLELKNKINSIVDNKNVKNVRNFVKRQDFSETIDAIVIGASTGGPKALMTLIKFIPKSLNIPIFIVQHMPSGFTKSFSNRLNQEAHVQVLEANNNIPIENGKIYVAPGDYHMRIENNTLVLDKSSPKLHGVRPSADYLFETAAKKYKSTLVGIILTGMGTDGTCGFKHIKSNNGYTIVQNQETSVVFGMPRKAIENGVVDEILSLNDIGERLEWLIKMKQST